RMLGASELKIFYSITLPKLTSAIASSCIPVFLFCFFSFMIVTLFGSIGTTTLEVELYQAACSLVDFNKASSIAIIETFIAIMIVSVYTIIEKKGEKSTGIKIHSLQKENLKKLDLIFFLPIIILIIFFFLGPLFSIALSAFPDFSFKSAKKVLFSSIFHRSIKNTILISTATATFSTIAAFTYAVFLRHSKNQHSFFRIVPVLPMAVSSVVMGFGMLVLVSKGSCIHLIIAETALIWPLAFRQLYIPLSKIKQETIDAAKMLSPSSLDIFFKIYLPNCKNTIFSAFIFCFASSAADTTLPLVLSIQKFDTLALYTYRLASSYRFSQASFCGLILGIICMLLFAISNKLKEEK
ncbi:MAG: ABC transporter permease subunit, partial [Treponema sp.]|nr:ABC transporter permease subunit [Treponema sp.]